MKATPLIIGAMVISPLITLAFAQVVSGPIQYYPGDNIDISPDRTISAVMPTVWTGAMTLNGSPIATDATVAAGGFETTVHAAATYEPITAMSAYSTTTQMNTAIAAAQPQKAHVTTATDGTVTWTYPVACPGGSQPYAQALAQATAGSTDVLNVQKDGAATITSQKFRVTRTNLTVVALLGLTILSVPTSPGATPLDVQVNCS